MSHTSAEPFLVEARCDVEKDCYLMHPFFHYLGDVIVDNFLTFPLHIGELHMLLLVILPHPLLPLQCSAQLAQLDFFFLRRETSLNALAFLPTMKTFKKRPCMYSSL